MSRRARAAALLAFFVLAFRGAAGAEAVGREAEQPVIALSYRGVHRAYPLTLFSGPRVVNDVVGAMEVAVYHDPERNFSAAWFRTVYGEPIEFAGTAAGAVADDVTTATRWDLSTGVAMGGNLQGQRLVPLPFTTTTWADLVSAHPAAQLFHPTAP